MPIEIVDYEHTKQMWGRDASELVRQLCSLQKGKAVKIPVTELTAAKTTHTQDMAIRQILKRHTAEKVRITITDGFAYIALRGQK